MRNETTSKLNSGRYVHFINTSKIKMREELPECHARGSKVPSKHYRPEYRPDRCEC